MSSRKEPFAHDEYYHICNRGAEGCDITRDPLDSNRFVESLILFNVVEPIGSIYEQSFAKPDKKRPKKKLVEIVAYCLNPNHFHLILKQLVENGISMFLGRLSGGFAYYINNRYKRSGSLYQGKFKARRILSNDDLLHCSAYVNLNPEVHQLGGKASKLVRSSWDEYMKESTLSICEKKIILDQFKNTNDYRKFALDSLQLMLEVKKSKKLDSFAIVDI